MLKLVKHVSRNTIFPTNLSINGEKCIRVTVITNRKFIKKKWVLLNRN